MGGTVENHPIDLGENHWEEILVLAAAAEASQLSDTLSLIIREPTLNSLLYTISMH